MSIFRLVLSMEAMLDIWGVAFGLLGWAWVGSDGGRVSQEACMHEEGSRDRAVCSEVRVLEGGGLGRGTLQESPGGAKFIRPPPSKTGQNPPKFIGG